MPSPGAGCECEFEGLPICHDQVVFVTWTGSVILTGPKPKQAGSLYICKSGHLRPLTDKDIPLVPKSFLTHEKISGGYEQIAQEVVYATEN